MSCPNTEGRARRALPQLAHISPFLNITPSSLPHTSHITQIYDTPTSKTIVPSWSDTSGILTLSGVSDTSEYTRMLQHVYYIPLTGCPQVAPAGGNYTITEKTLSLTAVDTAGFPQTASVKMRVRVVLQVLDERNRLVITR